MGNVKSGQKRIEDGVHVFQARSQRGHLQRLISVTKQSLINPFAILWVPWGGERKEH